MGQALNKANKLKDASNSQNESCSSCSQEFPTGDDCPAIIQCDACPAKYHFNCWKQLLDKSESCVGKGCNQLISLDNSTTNQDLNLSYEDLAPNSRSIKIVDDLLEMLDAKLPQRQKCCCCFSLKSATIIVSVLGILSLLNGILFFRRLAKLLKDASGHHYKGIIAIGVSVQVTGIVYGFVAIIVIWAILTKNGYRAKYIGHLTLAAIASATCNVIYTVSQLIYVLSMYHDIYHWKNHVLQIFVGGSTFNLMFNGAMTFYFASCVLTYRRECSNSYMVGISAAQNQADW